MLQIKKRFIGFALLCNLILAFGHANAQPMVILKLDDLGSKNGTSNAAPVLDYLLDMKIKTAIGVIAVRLDSTALKAYSKYIAAKNDKNENIFEVWNHGFTHTNNNPPGGDKREFDGTGYQFQKQHFNTADSIVFKLLGVQMHTFGSPYNAVDSNTTRVIAENKNYKVVLLDGKKSGYERGILHMNNRVNMEVATGVPNFDQFVIQYNNLIGKYPDVIVLQGHPAFYDVAKFEELKKIIVFLQGKKCQFVLPYDLYVLNQKLKR
ncbi:peptidoglycan/xylan/chitin deacetylase (PgdA/CDA1 family) [Mucilaginibacter gracilis]|uniref:Peptidoglycan/xylan/chitin deacetylase (PgdA/CDA1 family) n=1 Tax=Mucilaginibacter gracilis TaxID=423350 RepID=A0A495J423_9SPHI|nr:DUF2334 domain-containing protein [Mucilaginibacter gracilis]RKR83707.1 peptidoglycan/xylan/chitin deacetylase (PgdA/CDA1 family) [Mucilaginibacter gracilis]